MEQNKNSMDLVRQVTEAIDKIDKRLMGYQTSSVDFICNRFIKEKKNKCILADEVGLGKTEIAKGVIAHLASNHWNNFKNEERPFRVAYICPNQNIAAQNFRKLQIFPDDKLSLNLSEDTIRCLEENLASYHSSLKNCVKNYHQEVLRYSKNTNKNIQKGMIDEDKLKSVSEYWGIKISTPIHRSQIETVARESTYTRIWEWIIGVARGKNIVDILEEANLYDIYLGSGTALNATSEYAESRNNFSDTVIGLTEALHKKQIEILNNDQGGSSLANHIKNHRDIERVKKALGPAYYYRVNKSIAHYLFSGEDGVGYRLSMLHLLKAHNGNSVMQLDALTPKTSVDVSNNNGTIKERAVVGATYDVLYESDRYKAPDAEKEHKSYSEYYFHYRLKIKDLFEKGLLDAGEMKKSITSGMDIKTLRNRLSAYNLDHLAYDLVIMDEFQNYEKLVGTSTSGKRLSNEAEEIAGKIFSNPNTKVLMLSATPFSLTDYVTEIIDEQDDNATDNQNDKDESDSDDLDIRPMIEKEEALDQFFNLVKFMIGEAAEKEWSERWKAAMAKNEKSTLEEMLMNEVGIIRTERNAASLHSPIFRKEIKADRYDFSYVLSSNLLAEAKGWSRWRYSYGRTTPYGMSFAYTYKLREKEDESNKWCQDIVGQGVDYGERIFVNKSEYDELKEIKTSNLRFEKLKETLFSNNEDSPIGLLWIPPSKKECKLQGVFEGKHGISKSLIFSHFRMTPMAITYLLCQDAARRLSAECNIQKDFLQDELDVAVFEGFINEGIPEEYKMTRSSVREYLATLFQTTFAKMTVTLNCLKQNISGKSYSEAVQKYCEDGCLKDVLDEYFGLLQNEYSNDSSVAKELKKILNFLNENTEEKLGDNKKAKYEILFWNDNKVTIEARTTKNVFAAGLYGQNVADMSKRLKKIKSAFNSPFLPFIFTSTSIGTEGIDLHWYARNVIHWSLPDRPVDIEQREGRVLRYKCHAFRLNSSLGVDEDSCIRNEWKKSGMFESQLNFASDELGKSCYHVISSVVSEESGPEDVFYESKMRVVKTYRLMLGREASQGDWDDNNLICLSPWVHKKKDLF